MVGARGDDESRLADPRLARVRDAADAWRDARDRAADAADEFADALLDARKTGLPWSQLAKAAGMKDSAVRMRAATARQPTQADQIGVSVNEAAEQLGVTRQTIYRRIQSGDLRSVTGSNGRLRVILDD